MKTIAVILAAALVAAVLALPAVALAQQPGTLLPAPTYAPLPPAPPPAPVPSVVTPSAPLPGVTFRSGPSAVPSGSGITPSYRLKVEPSSYRRCKKRPGRRCRTS
jgi:hypothetical protein